MATTAGPVRTSPKLEAAGAAAARLPWPRDRVLRRLGLVGVVWLAAFAAATALAGESKIVGDVVYVVPVALAAALSVLAARARRGRARLFWGVLAASNVLWLAGELTWSTYELILAVETPFPSVADVLYLSSYALVIPAILLGFPGAGRLRAGRSLLDASILVVALGYTGYVLLLAPQLPSGASLPTLTGIAYPLVGVAILMVLGAVAFTSHRAVPRSVALVAVAFLASALTDAGYTYLAVLGTYVSGSWLNLGWQLEAVLLCLAAVAAIRHDEGGGERVRVARDPSLPIVLVGAGLALAVVLAGATQQRLSTGAGIVVAYTVGAVVLRLALTSREQSRVARELDRALGEQERLAVTDALTGLANRRLLLADLTRAFETAQAEDALLVLFDLDGFKDYNDAFGHPSGDALLARLGRQLDDSAAPIGRAYRMGGDEFCVLARPGREHPEPLIAEWALALSDRGEGFAVSASYGHLRIPAEAADTSRALRLADQRLYSNKQRRRASAGTQTAAVLIATLRERNRPLGEHGDHVAGLAADVARELGLTAEDVNLIERAAELHDIGKIAIPDPILNKPGPLNDREWEFVRRHTIVGERILSSAPALTPLRALVRSSHERWDGRGYPDGLSGEKIPLGARIIAACDAFDAMISDRPYGRRKSTAEALAELQRCAGTQFDPSVTDAFKRVWERRRRGVFGLASARST